MNPSVLCQTPGVYDVSLIVSNNNGCSDTLIQTSYLTIHDTIPPVANPIASVSVMGDQQVQIIWFNSNETDVTSYKLYRYNAINSTWALIHTDSNPTLQATAIISTFTDNVPNTKSNTYSYKLQTTDRCGFELPLQNLTAHTTIDINTSKNGLIVFVNWTAYEGCNISSYNLYRTERPSGSPVLISNVSNTTLNYTDSSLTCPSQYEYKVEAIDLCGNTYNSFSDTSAIWPENILINQQSNIVRSTVIYNTSILTEWMAPTIFPNRVLEYHVYKSIDKINFSKVGITPAGIMSFIDTDVDVKNLSYTYKVIVVNDCNLEGRESNIGKSIVLDGKWKDRKTYLNWNKYEQWDSGIDHYTIEFLSPQGTWVPVKTVDGNTTNTEFDD